MDQRQVLVMLLQRRVKSLAPSEFRLNFAFHLHFVRYVQIVQISKMHFINTVIKSDSEVYKIVTPGVVLEK